jgi:hypothetical protein
MPDNENLDLKCINTIRTLSMDEINGVTSIFQKGCETNYPSRAHSSRNTSGPVKPGLGQSPTGQGLSWIRAKAAPCKCGERRFITSRQRSNDRRWSQAARLAGPRSRWPSSQSNA